MLAHAIKVVEAARALGAHPGGIGIYRFTCEPRMLPIHIRELSEAIEAFDKAAGRGVDAEGKLVAAIGFAASRGIDVADMLSAIGMSEEDLRALAEADLKPKPGEMGRPDDVEDVSVSRQAVRNGSAVLGKDIVTADRYRHDGTFPGDAPEPEGIAAEDHPVDPMTEPAPPAPPEPEDAEPEDEPAADGEPALQELEDRIKSLESRLGWTEELRDADLLLRKAKGAMEAKETGGGGTAYRLNEESMRVLMAVALAIDELERGADLEESLAGPGLR